MEQVKAAITQLAEQLSILNNRITNLETRIEPPPNQNQTPPAPTNEAELNEIKKLPDCVRDLQIFEGNPVQYISWIHSVESILRDYQVVRNKPIFRAILQHIRQKIRGPADTALISYNIFDEEWEKIKTCLSLHYADKRDLRTLEYELSALAQRNSSLDQFYARINHQLSLIINKIKAQNHSQETVNALVDSYRNRALDIFIRGVNGDLSRTLIIQKPQNLPEAYASCLEIQNLNFRNFSIHPKVKNNIVTSPINQMYRTKNQFEPKLAPKQLSSYESNQIYNNKQNNSKIEQKQPPARPTQPKPSVPMDIDPSLHSHRVNYMNRPEARPEAGPPTRPSNYSSNIPRKQQKLFNIGTQEEPYEEAQEYEEPQEFETTHEYQEPQEYEENQECEEVNFMTSASLAYHT